MNTVRLLIIIINLIFLIMWQVDAFAKPQLPELAFSVEESDIYGLIIDSHYANLLSPTSALAFEIASGASEFRLGGTWAKMIQCRHRIKLTAEYLSQHNQFKFLPGSTLIWNDQHSVAAGYSYLFLNPWILSLNMGAYQTYSRDENVPTIIDVNEFIRALYRDVRGSSGYGANAGVTVQPWLYTKFDLDVYYDVLDYRNLAEPNPDKNGLGVGLKISQLLHPRIKLSLDAMQRVIFDQYRCEIAWLVPTNACSRLELSLIGQYTNRSLIQPHERRIGLMITYRWNFVQPLATYIVPKTLQEDIVAASVRPLVRMPQTFVVRDQKIIKP